MHIAICDDNHPRELKKIVEKMESFAADSGHPVRLSTFGDAGPKLAAAGQEFFNRYLLDIMMPGMDGITAAQEIRSFDMDAKLLFLTSAQEDAYQSCRVKAYDYLLKPVSSQEAGGE